MLSPKNIIYTVISLGLGFFLVWLVINLTPVSVEEVLNKLQHLNLIGVALVTVSTFTHLWLSAYKWRLITQKLTKNNQQLQSFYLSYVILANLAIQFVPQHIGLTFVQSLAIKLHKVTSLSKGIASVIYDQFLNIAIPLALLPPALLYMFGKVSLSWAIFISLGILLGIHYGIVRWNKPLILALFRLYSQLRQFVSRKQKSPQTKVEIEEIPIFTTRFTIRLFWLSVFRHFNWILRSFFVVMAGGFAINFWSIFFTTTLVQSAMLVSITPANLGFMEWSWIGGLRLLGVAAGEAGNFALLQRILGLSSLVIIALAFWSIMFINNLAKSRTKKASLSSRENPALVVNKKHRS